MNFWNNFAAKHPAAAKWVREGGLFVIVSNLTTTFKGGRTTTNLSMSALPK